MSDLWWLAALAAVILALGGALAAVALARQSVPEVEMLGLSLSLGLGASGYLLFLASLAGLVPSRGLLGGLGLAAAVALAATYRLGRGPRWVTDRAGDPSRHWLRWAGVTGLALAIGVVSLNALASSMFEWDAFAIWDFKARILSHVPVRTGAYFQDATLAFSHPAYPPGLPFQYAAVYAALGRADGMLAKLVGVAAFLAFCLMGYASLRHWLGRTDLALAGALLLVGCPVVLVVASSGYADLHVALFLLGSLHYWARWLAEPRPAHLALGGLFLLFLAHTKNEGLGVAVVIGLAMLAVTAARAVRADGRAAGWRRLAALALVAGAVATLTVPLLVWKAWVPALDEAYGEHLTWAVVHGNLPRLPYILQAFAGTVVEPQSWGAFWFLVPVAATVGWRAWRQPLVLWLWVVLVGHLGLYTLAYLITPLDLGWQLSTSVHRLTLHLLPAAILLIAAHWRAAREPLAAAGQPCISGAGK
jgi:hypothetical protein